ncbi:MAG: enoyl-CoA hydratase/isomerase family protein [Anaerolinea sp.]|nr:enoyl-CoA hydratase/isomerase family protein [Anaerolinea sp.]
MNYQIRKAGVIGSGTMGGGIATLLAGVGIPVVLLDLPARDTKPGDSPAKRNTISLDNLGKLKKSRVPAVFEENDLTLITVGNTEDDLGLLADCDWIVEVVVERLDVKHDLMKRLAAVRREASIISTNTSGLSINAICEGQSEEFRTHFLGTHFFNPPRHLKLLEIIPGRDTDPELVKFMAHFGESVLGKGVVICKDTPNFIANRFISIAGGFGMNYAIENGYSVEEIDNLTGPLIGRPKSGTFRLADVVGVDVLAHVATNLYPAIPDDSQREILRNEKMARATQFLLDNKFLGDKTGQGFYKKVTGAGGEREFWALDPNTLEYVPPSKARHESVGKVRKMENTGERIKALIQESDRAAQYVWHLHAFYLSYASKMLGEIADDLIAIDNANKWGFAHEMGPFEIWDAIGVRDTLARMEQDGYSVASWVKEMLEKGCETFYQRGAGGTVLGVYSPKAKDYVLVQPDTNAVQLTVLRATGKEVERNAGASLFDMGDGVLLLEFHTKGNALDEDIFRMMHRAYERLNTDFEAMVVGNQGDFFSGGANLMVLLMGAMNQQWDQVESMLTAGQNTLMAMRYSPKPIVTAPFNYAFGGGAEMTMHGSRVVAHAELYIGLVEFGVGVIPAWGGTKEMVRRVISPAMLIQNADPLPPMQKAFEQIALAKVSTSAMEARTMGFLGGSDRIVMNKDHLLAEAKKTALQMVANGYSTPARAKLYAAGRDVRSALGMAVYTLREGRFASEHDAKIAKKLAHVMCGGDLTAPAWVDEQYFLDLEREAFLSLIGEPKTMERIQFMLQNNKPLRN